MHDALDQIGTTVRTAVYRLLQVLMLAWTVWAVVQIGDLHDALVVARAQGGTLAPLFAGAREALVPLFLVYWSGPFAALGVLALMVRPPATDA